jgi:hypothetical protein
MLCLFGIILCICWASPLRILGPIWAYSGPARGGARANIYACSRLLRWFKLVATMAPTEVVVPGRYPRTLSDGRRKHLEVAVSRVCCVSLVCKGPFVAVFNPRHALPDIG